MTKDEEDERVARLKDASGGDEDQARRVANALRSTSRGKRYGSVATHVEAARKWSESVRQATPPPPT